MNNILLITPPFTQLNTPYPATAYLKGFLNTRGVSAFQMDLGIEVILELFTKKSLQTMFEMALEEDNIISENSERIYHIRDQYLKTIEPVISFLQGKCQTLARQICTGSFLPTASRFEQLDDSDWAFGSMGIQDRAKHLATLYLEDISDFIVECIDDNFGFSRYAEKLGMSANNFDQLYLILQKEQTHIDKISLSLLEKAIEKQKPKLICFSVPFPGNLYSAFRCAKFIKQFYPDIKIAMGGGFPNTELRSLKDKRVFEFFDFITLDDGELPIELLISNVLNPQNNIDETLFKRTFLIANGKILYENSSKQVDYKQAEIGTPDYSDLLLDKYISVIELTNPMHSLWSDGRWNKLTMAHGCYWGKCTFCDISLDYIKLYEPLAATLLVDRMEQIIEQTGENGFHFVDEAAPPSLMKALAIEIIRRGVIATWWTNIRFEKNFTKDLCLLLQTSGCIAVSGGLEVASNRLLELIQKGVTVEQVAQVTRNFTDSGIMVHAYLMYGYPSQSIQETIDSLEMVRQMFELGILQSGFWHQFALTTHSPIGQKPSDYGITPLYKEISFANNDIQFEDKTGINHDKFSFGLKKSLFNFMHGIGFETALSEWFDFSTPKTTIGANFIEDGLALDDSQYKNPTNRIIWIGSPPMISNNGKKMIELTFHNKSGSYNMFLDQFLSNWLCDILNKSSIQETDFMSLSGAKADYESQFENFESFWYSDQIQELRNYGLLIL